jgi:hypothetical protein
VRAQRAIEFDFYKRAWYLGSIPPNLAPRLAPSRPLRAASRWPSASLDGACARCCSPRTTEGHDTSRDAELSVETVQLTHCRTDKMLQIGVITRGRASSIFRVAEGCAASRCYAGASSMRDCGMRVTISTQFSLSSCTVRQPTLLRVPKLPLRSDWLMSYKLSQEKLRALALSATDYILVGPVIRVASDHHVETM